MTLGPVTPETPDADLFSMNVNRFVLIVTSLSLALGCSTVTPASFRAKAPNLSLSWPGPVSVTPGYDEIPESRFNANGMVFEVNLHQFSEQLAGLSLRAFAPDGSTP